MVQELTVVCLVDKRVMPVDHLDDDAHCQWNRENLPNSFKVKGHSIYIYVRPTRRPKLVTLLLLRVR